MPKLFSTRRTSLKQLLGITRAKRRFSRKTGLGQLRAVLKPQQTLKRRLKRAAGYESAPMRALRNAGKRRYLFGIIPLWTKK
jgi:hypothetical protein